MFLSHSRWRAIAGGAALTAALVATPAQAATVTTVVNVDGQCRFPLTGVQPIHATITTTAPDQVSPNGPLSDIPHVQLTLDGPGKASASSTLQFGAVLGVLAHQIEPSGPSDPAKDVKSVIPWPTQMTAAANAETSTTVFPPYGGVSGTGSGAGTTLTVTRLALNETVLDQSGNPVTLPAVTTDVDGNPWTPQDSRETIPCKITPTGDELWRVKVGAWFTPPFGGASNPGVDTVGSTTATVHWTPVPWGSQYGLANVLVTATDPEGVDAPHKVVVPATASTATLTDLRPDHTYSFTISGYFPETQRQAEQVIPPFPGTAVMFRTKPLTDPPPFPLSWTLAGSAKLARGNASLSGSLVGLDLGAATSSAGAFSLNPTAARLVYSGLPITAALSLAPVGTASSTRTGDSVTLTTDVRVKVTQAKLFGLLLVSGSTCQSSKAVTLSLTGSVTRTGGTITGPLTVPPLTGCGAFNGIVSSAVAGTGKGVSLTLTPNVPIG